MANRADIIVGNSNALIFNGGGTNYVVQTPSGVLYMVITGKTTIGVNFIKSTDGGLTWSNSTSILNSASVVGLSVWYDRWSGIAADLIHVAYIDGADGDIKYRSIDAANSDTLSTQTVVFAGSTTAAGGAFSITRSRNGDLRVAGSIDAGAEDGAWSSTDVGGTWTDTIADPSEGATTDQYLLLPGWNADTADTQLIFWDASADELSVKRYDDSADTWTETSIATTMVDTTPVNSFPHVAAFVDIANSRNIVVAWSRVDFANADLRCWVITDTTITETTSNVVLNSTDDQGNCAVGIDTITGYWYVFYGGKSDGSETWATSLNIYYKVSKDAGVTWGAETQVSNRLYSSGWLMCCPRFANKFNVAWYHNTSDIYIVNSVPTVQARARYQMGVI